MKNILFDLDDTLLNFGKAERIALTKTLVHFGIEPREEVLARYSELNLAQWKRLEKGELTREQVKVRRYALLFDELGVDCSPADATAFYETQLSIGHYFVEGAEAVLQALYPVYRLYLVTNGTARVQHGRIESAGIARYFSGMFISQEIGFDKPQAQFFTYCFAQIPDFCKADTVIVGDSLSSDILGGKNAGITTVWFNPKHQPGGEIVPDYEIDSLSALPGLLQGI
ncbi:MAG: YjjG family noncanonical pyrimidine nucleotidase [Clostridia bacterium]|nr:YjjG family noncanonical pyrimidine nucleotidase [Clostridia bacterium]